MRWSLAVPAAVAACLGVLSAPLARAAMVYQWVDERGVMHFGDAPPASSRDYRTKTLPDAPPAPPPAAEAAPGEADTAPAAASDTPREGPARVVLKGSETVAVGPSRQAIRGKVKNDGGAPARDIVISVVVSEPVQGAECLRDVIDVQPSTLAPGAEGTFDAEFDNPCFHGPTTAALTAEWR